ncbi:TonB-dependent receptor [Thalassotalea agarivorans]|uniref:Iron complex outermembrane recepter protein n=1 Tax=Thalassotalea agarivorans TaxID=349064 RepID=A0A1I0HV50_THASX|nr:TonB-dependent receptor [Thalassotalea agarivorans]SET87710.1 iron complex outermembrane recepter protein [Thalassotalea agarivorans]
MSSKTFKKGILATSIAMAVAGVSAPMAIAAEEANATNDETEVIEVRGLRGSLKENINAKRFSDGVVDVITAEDIGKFPDRNVAESLARIPGVTIQRQFGEGSAVSIRGAGAEFTKTTLNGQNVASTGWFVLEPAKRSFNYELLPSELVGDLEVYKSAQADLIEGGVGGTVIVNTRTPLELDANTVYASLEGEHSDDSGEVSPQLSGMYSWKNDAENFGVLVSAVAQERALQRQGNEAFWEWGAGPVAFEQDRKRSALTVALEYAPTENLSFVFNALDMKMEADNTNYALWLTQGDTSWSGNTPDACLGGNCVNPRGTAVQGQLATGYYQARPREATMNSDVIDLVTTYEADSFTLDVQIGRTTSTGGTDFEMVVDDGVNTPIVDGTYDFTGDELTWSLPNGIGGQSMADYDPGSLLMGTGTAFNKTPKTDEETYAQIDLELPLDMDFISSVKMGARVGQHNTTSRQMYLDQEAGFNNRISTADLRVGTIDVGYGDYQISKFDVDAIKAWAKASIVGETEELGAYSEIDETNTALYVMANYGGENFRGNFGVRYVQTDATSTYYLDGNKTEAEGDYSEILPSFTLAYDLTDEVVLRAAAARVMARPQYNDMYTNPSAVGANDDVPDNQFWIMGNVDLDPFLANQFEIGVEWYFNESSLLSATVFMKQVENFISIAETYNVATEDLPNGSYDTANMRPDEIANGWTVQEKQNSKKGDVSGLELQYQQDFSNGFGLLANYTYTDTSTDSDTFTDMNPFLSDSSDHVFNATGYYENDDFSVRVSYNYRSEYMLREEGAYGNRLHDGFGTLDISGVYHVTENIDLSLDVINATGEDSLQFGNNAFQTNASGFADGFPLYQYEMATRVVAGVAVRF